MSDRTSVKRLPGGRYRLRSPDGAEAEITAWMLSDLLHDATVQRLARKALWESPIPFRVVDGEDPK